MKYIYTCFTCGFPFAVEESECPEFCPSCSAPKSQYLVEPWNGSIEARRIHVDPPEPDPNWDKYNIAYHHCKQFPAGTRHGRVRRFVLPYEDAALTKKFYEEIFDWDIIPTEHADEKDPLMFAATGPGFANWEPRFPSYGFGFLKSVKSDDTGRNPRYMIEVDSIDELLPKLEAYGGKLLKAKYTVEGNEYAVVEDSEGNAFYIWQTPASVTFKEPESQNYYKWDRNDPWKYAREFVCTYDPTSAYPYRAPKKYPKKDLHGRLRFLHLTYKCFERFQKFYVDLFGWDMFALPEAAGGTKPGDPNPGLLIGSGPSYETWEAVVPGHMNVMASWCGGEELKEPSFTMEIHMDEPVKVTADKVVAYGGTIVGDIPEEKEGWTASLYAKDPNGTLFNLWRCPSSRTWDEAEACSDEAE